MIMSGMQGGGVGVAGVISLNALVGALQLIGGTNVTITFPMSDLRN